MRDSRGIVRAACVSLALLVPASNIASQAPTPVNLYVADVTYGNGGVHISNPRKLTGDRGVSSQPAFSLDGKSILFVSRRDTTGQSDVYRIDLASGAETRVTKTPENENTPTPTRDGGIMVIRWTPPTLFKQWGPWIYDRNGVPLRGVLPGPDTVGYYVPIDATTYAMMRPKSRPAVAIFDSKKGTMTDYDWPVANLPPQLVPSRHAVTYTRIDSLGRNEIRQLDLRSMQASDVAPTVPGRTVHAWTPNGFILMGKGNAVYAINPARHGMWTQVTTFSQPDLQSVSTYVLSPRGDKVILISPLKPALHQALRDSIIAGRDLSSVLEQYGDGKNSSMTTSYEISEGGLLALAGERASRGNLRESIQILHLAGNLIPASYEVQMQLGAELRKNGDNGDALAAYRRALSLNPRTTADDKTAAETAEKAIAELSHN